MKIKTDFWKSEDAEHYKEKMIKIIWAYIIFFLTNITYYLLNGNYTMMTINLIPFTISILAHKSHTKYEGEKRKWENTAPNAENKTNIQNTNYVKNATETNNKEYTEEKTEKKTDGTK